MCVDSGVGGGGKVGEGEYFSLGKGSISAWGMCVYMYVCLSVHNNYYSGCMVTTQLINCVVNVLPSVNNRDYTVTVQSPA